jgi:putative ABC transport system permease protein
VRALFRFVCLAYPRDFRSRYFRQIVGDYEQHQADVPGGFAYLFRMLSDVLVSGLQLRFEMMGRDLSIALRRLRQSPLLVSIVIITFALGIGANVTVFSVLNAVLLQPLPYPNAPRLMALRTTNPHWPEVYADSMSLPDVWDMRTRTTTLQNITAFNESSRTLTGYGKPVALRASDVTWRFFDTLGIKPQLGRFASQQDAEQGRPQVVISDALWRSRFNGDANIIGKAITLNGVATQIIGVAPPGFQTPEPFAAGFFRADLWTFISEHAAPKFRGWRSMVALALLRPGVSFGAAQADLNRVQQQLRKQYPGYDAKNSVIVTPLRAAIVGTSAPVLLWMIFCAVLGVFAIMCANVASLLLTQTNARTHELSMRVALGASRARIMQQLLTESGVLAVLGGIVGVGIAYVALREFTAVAQDQIPRLAAAHIDVPGLLYSTGIVILAALLAGSAPAWMLASTPALSMIRTASRSGVASNRRLQSALVVLEIAIALALVTASGLSIRSFYALTHADIGVRTQGVFLSEIFAFPRERFTTPGSKNVVIARLKRRLAAIPGTTYALAVNYPLGDASITSSVDIAGVPHIRGGAPEAVFNPITPAYFAAMGIPLRRGRAFTNDDSPTSESVAIVSASFAKYFPKGTPLLDQRLRINVANMLRPSALMRIVGVVGDTRNGATASVQPVLYVPLTQTSNDWINAVVYAPHADARAVRSELADAFQYADPLSASPVTHTYAELMADSAQSVRFSASLFTALGLIALALAIAGIFGVVSYAVSQRQAEFGIRMAIGSTPIAIMGNVLTGVAVLLAAGIAIGLVLAAIAGRAIGTQLYDVQSLDVATLTAVTAILASTALLAGALPAVRAARVDPARTLRYE